MMFRAIVLCLCVAFATAGFPMGERLPVAPVAFQADTGLDAAALDIAVPLVAKWEGKRNAAYLDIVGVPTICFGSTRGIKLGDYMSDAQCAALLRAEVAEYQAGFKGYLLPETVAQRLTPQRFAAFTSTAYNVGISGIGRSTATRRLNAGDIPGACKALTWWNKAGGRVVPGLVNRRTEEWALCMVGV
jgi:lysozyme